MTLLSYLLQAAFALALAYLGGAFLCRSSQARRPGDSSEFPPERLLGFALLGSSALLALVSAGRFVDAWPALPLKPSVAVAGLALVLCLASARLGWHRSSRMKMNGGVVFLLAGLLVSLLVVTNGGFSGADLFLITGLAVWMLATRLLGRTAK